MTMQELIATCAGGIIMTAESVQATREGRKTQTRRVLKQAYDEGETPATEVHPDGAGTGWIAWFGRIKVSTEDTARRYPGAQGFRTRYQSGRRYYVKETWQDYCPLWDGHWCGCGNKQMQAETHRVVYDAGPRSLGKVQLTLVPGKAITVGEPKKWQPAHYMPRWAARYVIEVDRVRVQRLQDITEEDAIAEGMDVTENTAKERFAIAWDTINYFRSPWSSNPWVAAYTYHLVKP